MRQVVIIILVISALLNDHTVTSINQKQLNQYLQHAFNSGFQFYWFLLKNFNECVRRPTGNQLFKADDLQGYLVYPARTTVGVAPDYTTNRKYFANMLGTTEFKEMLSEDTKYLHRDLVAKIKYCDTIVMDPDMMRHFYSLGSDDSVTK